MKYIYIKRNNHKNSENNENNTNNENNEKKPKKKLKNKTKKHKKISINKKHKSKLFHKTQKKQKHQKGGNTHCTSTSKENFELHSLKDFDYDKYKVSKDANIDWGSIGGPPPEPDCCIC